ncbi:MULTISPECIES: NADP-dependent malic enzyme [Carboxydocella]|uniref:Malate dehydrogenase (Oxaloacetate-decarboxylating) n=2 Tax=Carboxydocella TaxID=178898 RepID=A0A1T4LWH8_9FIRM|nr:MULTISPECIES: malic enzyme-like NAD(P)-binding protein [Carboxydocella]AVX20649.1 malate dehydrogenase (oxaloacetate-decarboxylating) [Carboxydocella thermautotrophica]AVX31072.1 malate dehydrogenase (oxaloacetate-decarboxylating) [Carboxydocella thermautotrophica]GAW32499.1 malate dehydrogenase [Carboxydocella sp. JDF658]SJZ59007.1 malate dehydrogenase (oxaloacetate-decarboxylating) [Carboxydocella sporoproducens DSM 16521]
MNIYEKALELHRKHIGKIEVISKVPVNNAEELSLAYSPGVAEPCREISKEPEKIYEYTAKGNLVAVVSDGTAVLGLGDIGPLGAMPVMEGKAVLFKEFAGVDAFPICLNTKDPDKIVETVKLLEPTFGGVNLEDIAAPNCFIIEERLKKETNIPIFHDDQHGTAIVAAAAIINALKVVNKKIEEIKLVVNGAGASAIACTKLLMSLGVKNIIMCDSKGPIYKGRKEGMNPYKEAIAEKTNQEMVTTSLRDALKGADVFMGLSKAKQVDVEMVKSMAPNPIILAMANPEPEIMPELAKAAGAAVIGTGRSDYPNQVNNVLAFPGIFRGALDVRATDINEEMKLAAAYAIANLIAEAELSPEYIIPKPFDPRVAPAVAAAVAQAAMQSGVARITVDPQQVAENCKMLVEKIKNRK